MIDRDRTWIHSEHLQKMDFHSMISKRTWILECCPQQSFRVRVFKNDLKSLFISAIWYKVGPYHRNEVIGSSQTWFPKNDKIILDFFDHFISKNLIFFGNEVWNKPLQIVSRLRPFSLCSRLNQNHIPRHAPYHEHSKCTNTQSDWQCMHDISINWVIHLQKTSKRLVSSRIKVIQGHNDMTHFLLFG